MWHAWINIIGQLLDKGNTGRRIPGPLFKMFRQELMNGFGERESYLEAKFDIEFSDDLNGEGRGQRGGKSVTALKFLCSLRKYKKKRNSRGERL